MFEFVFPGKNLNKPKPRSTNFAVRIPAKSASKSIFSGMFAPKVQSKDMTMALLLK